MAFGYYKPVVVDNTKVSGTGDLSNFPVLINKTDALLKTTANGGHVTSNSGYDIYFYSDSALTTKLDHELIFYAPTTGQVIAWVRVPTLDGDADTTIYMAYGDSGITTNPSTTGTWDSTIYGAVFHGNAIPSGTVYDSTGGHTLATATNSAAWEAGDSVTGKIYKALNFVNADKRYVLINDAFDDISADNTFTLQHWVNIETQGSAFYSCYTRAEVADNYLTVTSNGTKVYGRIRSDDGSAGFYADTAADIEVGWHLYHAVKNSNSFAFYVDGASKSLTTYGTAKNTKTATSSDFQIGRYGAEEYYGTHLAEEMRICKVVLSSDWIATEYANQNAPNTFLSLGTEVEVGGGEPPATAIKDLIGGFIPYPR